MVILRTLLAFSLVLLMQGPAMLMQEVAWVKMLVSYSQERGLGRGLIVTFDGQHPCELCEKAAEIRKQQQSHEPGEAPPTTQRFRLAWAEMIPGDPLKMPVILGTDLVPNLLAFTGHDSGKGTEAPDSPPPELG